LNSDNQCPDDRRLIVVVFPVEMRERVRLDYAALEETDASREPWAHTRPLFLQAHLKDRRPWLNKIATRAEQTMRKTFGIR
jgi:hypothetical protein